MANRQMDTVQSEILQTANDVYDSRENPNHVDSVKIFTLRIPTKQSDGEKCLESIILKIDHSKCTTLDLVGLQVWRGALILADFVINNGESLFDNKTVIELACGVGLTGITAAMYSHRVIFSDIAEGGILETVEKNISNNKEVIKSKTDVISLDFFSTTWSQSVESAVNNADIILAADVVYDDEVTEAFVKTLVKIYKNEKKKTIFIALEKRYIFTIADLDVVAPCYDYFLKCMSEAELENELEWNIELLPTDFPKYFDYERNDELIVWKITN